MQVKQSLLIILSNQNKSKNYNEHYTEHNGTNYDVAKNWRHCHPKKKIETFYKLKIHS